jgi:hypothetical protein
MAKEIIMHSSFGIDRRPTTTQWKEIVRGPTAAEVRAHIKKLANFLEPLK